MSVQLITRTGCHLCEDAESALRELGIAFEAVDVERDPELIRLYDFRVPVVLSAGRVVAEGRVDVTRLRAALAG